MVSVNVVVRGSEMDRLLFKVPEAAAQLGISRAKLYELLASGALASVKVGGCRRIRSEDLRAFVDGLASSSSTSDRGPAATSQVAGSVPLR